MVTAKAKTVSAVAWDDNNLYICIRAEEPVKFYAVERERDSPRIFNNDCVEVMIDTHSDCKTFFHFVVDILNARYDGKKQPDGNYSSAWNGKWESKVKKDDKGFIVEIGIPFKTILMETPKANDKCRIAVFRVRRAAGNEYQALSPTLGGFHEPKYRADLLFCD